MLAVCASETASECLCVCLTTRLGCVYLAVCVVSSHRMVSCVSALCCNQTILGARQFGCSPSLRVGGWIYREDSSSSFCGCFRLTGPS